MSSSSKFGSSSGNNLSAWYGTDRTEMVWDDTMQEPTAADHGDVLYNIGKSPMIGRYMEARRDIHPGEVIFTDQPAVIGPDNNALPMCTVCWRKLSGHYHCPKCGWPLCGDRCRTTKIHQRECVLFQERGTKVQISGFGKPNRIYDAVLPLRLLFQKFWDKKVYRLVCLLMDHKENQSPAQERKHNQLAELIRVTWGFAKDFSVNEVRHVLGILSVNSFVVHDGLEDGMDLIGLYPWTSLMSHACVPNVKIITRDDFSYICEATVPIKSPNEIVTSYHHYYYHLFGTMYRRSDIRHTWSFDCICHRCKDPTELGTFVSAVNCEKCKYSYLLPLNPLDHNSQWGCHGCSHTESNEEVSERLSKFEKEIDSVEPDQPEGLEAVLRKMRYCLHENHYLITDCKRRLIDLWGHSQDWDYSKLTKQQLEKKSDYCDHLLGLAAKLSPGHSELRGYLLWERHGAQLRLAQWDWLRMKCTTLQYIHSLKVLCENLREIIVILGPIRVDSDEGANGLKNSDGNPLSHLQMQPGRKGGLSAGQCQARAKNELEVLSEQLEKLEKQTQYTTGQPLALKTLNRTERKFNRRSFCL